MRLSELNPTLEDAGDGAAYLEFACPAHGVGHMRHAQPELDPPFEGFPDTIRIKIAVGPQGTHVWGWNGAHDFEKMVITPSIDYRNGDDHWHGFIGGSRGDQPGEVTTC